MPSQVEIVEVGARDGLQNEKIHFSTDQKLTLINKSIDAGVRRLEVASFVHPKLVPQMADAEAVVAGLDDRPDVTYIGLVLNKRGLLRALETKNNGARGIDEIGCVAVAADGFGMKNQGQTRKESITTCQDIIRMAKEHGLRAQATISVSFGCPYDGEVSMETVTNLAQELAEEEPIEIAIADTIGVADPFTVSEMVLSLKDKIPGMPIRAHFHNTRGIGIANAYAAFNAGASILDASCAGLGGCPFAPKATGNIATEELVYMLDRGHVATGIDLKNMIDTARWVETILGRPSPSLVAKAGGFQAKDKA